MSRFNRLDIGPDTVVAVLIRSLLQAWNDLTRQLNGSVSFGALQQPDNLDGVWLELTTVGVNANFDVTHNLGRVPAGYIVLQKDRACDLYNGSGGPAVWTATTIQFRSSVTGAKIQVFIV